MPVSQQLNKKATLNKNVAVLHLPKVGDDVKPGTVCRVAGWGKFHNNSPRSDILREVNVTVIDRKICNDKSHYNYSPVIGLNMICAGSPQGGKDSCNVSKIRSQILAVGLSHTDIETVSHTLPCRGISFYRDIALFKRSLIKLQSNKLMFSAQVSCSSKITSSLVVHGLNYYIFLIFYQKPLRNNFFLLVHINMYS